MATALRAAANDDPNETLAEKPSTSLGFFGANDTIREILAAAIAIERAGQMPELRFCSNGDDPEMIELFIADVPSMIKQLHASLTQSPKH